MDRYEVRRLIAELSNMLKDGSGPATAPEARRKAGLYTQHEAAELMGVKPANLLNAIKSGNVTGGSVRPKRRSYYTRQDVARLKLYFETRDKTPISQRLKRERDARGYYSKIALAELCGVQPVALEYHIRRGRFQQPTHQLEGHPGKFYTEKEAQRIARIMDEQRDWLARGRRGRRSATWQANYGSRGGK